MWNIFESGIKHHNPSPPLIILVYVLQKLLAVKKRVKGNKYWKIVYFVYEFVELSPFVECACFVEINVWNLNDMMLNMILNVRCLSAIKEKSTGC